MFTTFKKIIRYGWSSFYRHKALSFATIFVLVLTLLLTTALFLLQHTADFLILELKERVDMSVFLKQNLLEEDILFLKEKIGELPGVVDVEHVSADEALEKFIKRFEHNPAIMEALDIVPFNPLLSSFLIRAETPAQYIKISYLLRTEAFAQYIDRVDFDPERRQLLIDRLFAITANINTGGITLSLLLAFMAILVTFNTISLAIHNAKDEIATMRLIGASNIFIKGPFIIQGIFVGIFSALIASIVSAFLIFLFNQEIMLFTDGLNLWAYFLNSLHLILLMQLTIGIILGSISSLIAIRKYLKV